MQYVGCEYSKTWHRGKMHNPDACCLQKSSNTRSLPGAFCLNHDDNFRQALWRSLPRCTAAMPFPGLNSPTSSSQMAVGSICFVPAKKQPAEGVSMAIGLNTISSSMTPSDGAASKVASAHGRLYLEHPPLRSEGEAHRSDPALPGAHAQEPSWLTGIAAASSLVPKQSMLSGSRFSSGQVHKCP